MKYVRDKDLNDVVAGFVALGWVVERRTRHVVVRNPDDPGDRLTLHAGGTAPCYEFVKRCRSKLKRARSASEGGVA